MEASGTISSVSDLLSALEGHSPSSSFWYRGQSNEDWGLLPSLARESDGLNREWDLIAKFKQNASLLLTPLPRNDWEWLTIMQHHRVPTRLLDWTESPLVALYFAVTPANDFDGALWILQPTMLNRVSNIYPDYDNYIPNFDEQLTESYSPSSLRAERVTKLEPIAIIGPRNTPRMQAQLGVFTVIHREATAVEEVGDGQHVRKFLIPFDAKKTLMKQLSSLSVNKFQLFPDLQSLGELLKGDQDA